MEHTSQPSAQADDDNDLKAAIKASLREANTQSQDIQAPDGCVVKPEGHKYLWGVVEVENKNHCIFCKLHSLLIRTFIKSVAPYL
ncbi:hypothetical protein BGY98DRAFT_1099800 [Russula aff. rugulosa BPL654]|nr:hypothetical protein BGY98DRAFT_1100284 [Russula aff. rugulosa BPL654]KAI0272804.1 hypothetical protein BGY98DRAFT_1099800 [Russula aff. rugulosa BPL654]